MKERLETEIKLRVSHPPALQRQLRELGFRLITRRYLERNCLFDFPDRRLQKARCLVRLRFEGRQAVLTYKGAPIRSNRYKVRRESETPVNDGCRAREILEGLGLRETFLYEKYRTVYAPAGREKGSGSSYLAYDETPIGNYLELEGPPRWIDRVARRLGYSRQDYITRSYLALYFQKCAELGREPESMVFTAR